MRERPLGWRPLTPEQRAIYAENDLFDEEAIDRLEDGNVYAPVESGVWAVELGIALLKAGVRIHGPVYADDVRTILSDRAAKYRAGNEEEQIEAPMVERLIGAIAWDAIKAAPS